MKKLLVLTLVLGIASLASAGLDLNDLDGVSYAVDTGTQVITISTTLENTGFGMNLLPDVAMGVTPAPDAYYLVLNDPGFWYGNFGEGHVLIAGSTTTPTTGDLLTIGYAAGVTNIDIYDGMFGLSEIFAAGGNVSLNGYSMTIPEPATMAILGLGALLIRRKK